LTGLEKSTISKTVDKISKKLHLLRQHLSSINLNPHSFWEKSHFLFFLQLTNTAVGKLPHFNHSNFILSNSHFIPTHPFATYSFDSSQNSISQITPFHQLHN
jgi:hypothetical protein